MTEIIIFDTEFTTWAGAHERFWTGPDEYREIVQIAALRIEWPSGKILDSLDVITKPVLNPNVSDYFTNLTGVTQERINGEGVSFDEGMNRFADFCKDALVFSHGNDGMIMAETALLHKLDARRLYEVDYQNITPYIRRFDPTARVNSGRLWEHFKLPKPHEKAEHDGLFDCYSIRAALLHLHAQGAVLPF